MKIRAKFFSIIVIAAMALSLSMPCCLADTGSDNGSLKPKTKVEKKAEAKKVLKKFLKTMIWVGGSSVVIVLLLLAYKRFKKSPALTNQVDIEKNLNTPETIEEASKFVIEKF